MSDPRKKKNVPMRDKRPCPRCGRPSAVTARTGGWCFWCRAMARRAVKSEGLR